MSDKDHKSALREILPFSKNIILNIIPISNDSSDIVSIKRENKSYINNIQEITSKFPSLKFLYTSTNIRIIESTVMTIIIRPSTHNIVNYFGITVRRWGVSNTIQPLHSLG